MAMSVLHLLKDFALDAHHGNLPGAKTCSPGRGADQFATWTNQFAMWTDQFAMWTDQFATWTDTFATWTDQFATWTDPFAARYLVPGTRYLAPGTCYRPVALSCGTVLWHRPVPATKVQSTWY